MFRLVVFQFVLIILTGCSKNKNALPAAVIPNIIYGVVLELNVAPTNITTPDKASVRISQNNTIYKVDFNAVPQAQSNATITFETDSILTPDSREFASLGNGVIAYNPVAPNELIIRFTDGRKVTGFFNIGSSFGGEFGATLISQWRDPADPAKPTQKARNDIRNLIGLYEDSNGSAPGITPIYLSVHVSNQ